MQKRNLRETHFAFALLSLKSFFHLATFLGIFFFNCAVAEESTESILSEVIVNAPHPLVNDEYDDSLSEITGATHFSEKDLAIAHERTIDEVLRGHHSIGITKGGAFGVGLLHVRGVGGQGLVSLDGMPVPDSLPGVINLNALLPDGLESIEVNKGFGFSSRTFASMGGSIDLKSRRANDDSADLRVEGGTFGFLKETLRGNLNGEKAHAAFTVNRSDAFDGAYHAQKSNDNPERDPFHSTQALMKAGVDFSSDVVWEVSMLYRNSKNEMDNYGIRQGVFAMADEIGSFLAEESWMAQSSLNARINADWHTRLQLGYTHTDTYAAVTGMTPGYTADLYLARWVNDQQLWRGKEDESIHLIWGAEGRYEIADAPTFGPPPALTQGANFSESRTEQAGFLETRFAYGKFSGDMGIRYESFDRFQNHALVHAGIA